MTREPTRRTAEIIPFPVGGQRTVRHDMTGRAAALAKAEPFIVWSGSWYHQAAIEEETTDVVFLPGRDH